jgi:hypothetical protein
VRRSNRRMSDGSTCSSMPLSRSSDIASKTARREAASSLWCGPV